VHIVQVVGWYFPQHAGGTEVYVDALAQRLLHAGHDVSIAAPEPGGAAERTYLHNGLPVYRYPTSRTPSRAEAQGRAVTAGAERLHRWLERSGADVVHMHTFVTGMGLDELRVAHRLGARTIVTTHSARLGFSCQRGSLMRWGRGLCDGVVRGATCASCSLHAVGLPRGASDALALLPAPVSGLAGRLPGKVGTALGLRGTIAWNREAQRQVYALADRFVVLTEFARGVLLANGAPVDRVAVNRLGLRFTPRRRPAATADHRREPLTVAYIGRFDPVKGVYELARAIASLPHALPIRFVMHGPVRNKADLAVQARVKQIVGPQAWVTFGGELDAAGVQALLERVDVVCCPSIVIEGGPTIALEARASGVPVIGTDLPGLSEIVRDHVDGRLVPARNWRALATLFRDLAHDPGQVARWRDALPADVRTMDDVTADYLELYR
jgi:glycosyltransferase involved in cell wall biosynthesis